VVDKYEGGPFEREIKITLVGDLFPNNCDDSNPCTKDAYVPGVGCTHENVPDDSIALPQVSPNDCIKEVCRNGKITSINDPSEVRQNPFDVSDDCFLGTTCQPDDTEVPGQDSPNDCKRQICQNGLIITVIDDSETPIESSPDPHDCLKLICYNGRPYETGDDTEEPPVQESPHDCWKQICLDGEVFAEPDDSEIPLQASPQDCLRQICYNGEIYDESDDTEIPAQLSPNDCLEEVCHLMIQRFLHNCHQMIA
jgi:hypothetical protein